MKKKYEKIENKKDTKRFSKERKNSNKIENKRERNSFNKQRKEKSYKLEEETEKSISDNMYDFTGETEKQSYIYGRNAVAELLKSGQTINKVWISNAAGVTPLTIKTSAGAVSHIKIARVTNIVQTLKELKEKGMWVVGTDLETDNMYTKTNLTGDMAVVIGNEEKGISRLVKEECDILVKIPMIGKVQSLNASVSAGIIIYEIVRQRLEKKQ